MATGRKFAVFDIDGTLIRWQLYHAIADSLVKLGFIDADKYQSIIDARMVWKRRESSESFRRYELELVKLYDEMLKQVSVDQFEAAASAVFDEYKDQTYVYTRNLIKQLKRRGYLLFAISGSQKAIINKMAKYYGFDDFVASEDEQKDNRFTGKRYTPVFNKDAVVKMLTEKYKLSLAGSIGVGDSRSDIKMLEMVEWPIVFNPERELYEHAKQQGWKIVIERKNMIYELEKIDGKYQLVKTN